MIRGSYRKFDNTFTVAFEYQVGGDEVDGDDGRVNSEKVNNNVCNNITMS